MAENESAPLVTNCSDRTQMQNVQGEYEVHTQPVHNTENGESACETSDMQIPRPCYYLHRVFGLWYPKQSSVIFKVHQVTSCIFVIGCCAAITYLDRFRNNRLDEILNSVCTVADFFTPFIFTVYYFHKGQYDSLIQSIIEHEDDKKQLTFWSRIFTVISVVLWFACSLYFFFDWGILFDNIWLSVRYALIALYVSGIWAVWLSLYGFVCTAHCIQIQRFAENTKKAFHHSNLTEEDERSRLQTLLLMYSKLEDSLQRTQKDLDVIISLAVTIHVLDLIIFTCTFWDRRFHESEGVAHAPVWVYFGTLIFDLVSVFIKIYSAGKIAHAADKAAATTGKQCIAALGNDNLIPVLRFQLHDFVFKSRHNLSLHILGIQISMNLALAILVTVITATVSFTSAIIPRLQGK